MQNNVDLLIDKLGRYNIPSKVQLKSAGDNKLELSFRMSYLSGSKEETQHNWVKAILKYPPHSIFLSNTTGLLFSKKETPVPKKYVSLFFSIGSHRLPEKYIDILYYKNVNENNNHKNFSETDLETLLIEIHRIQTAWEKIYG